MMRFSLITIFPEMFSRVFDFGMVRKACEEGLLELEVKDLRTFTDDRRQTVDDRPFGGGDGMVLKAEPIFRAVEEHCDSSDRQHVVLLSPQGKPFDQTKAVEMSLRSQVTLICGRYEGVDQRVADHLADEEISVGDFVLSGGELGAMLIVEAVARLIPGVVAKGCSVLQDSFMDGLLDYPQYTRPAKFREWEVPEILLSGNHAKIDSWRSRESLQRTRSRRPDLLEAEGQ